MKATVRLSFGPTEVICHVAEGREPQAVDEARRWLDDRFAEYECEPLRPLGKVLTGDKLIAVAQAVGARGFQADEGLRADFARAAVAMLRSESVHVDVDAHKVSF